MRRCMKIEYVQIVFVTFSKLQLWALFKHTSHLKAFNQALSQNSQMHSGILARRKRIQLQALFQNLKQKLKVENNLL